MAQMTDIEKTEAVSPESSVSRLRLRLAGIFFVAMQVPAAIGVTTIGFCVDTMVMSLVLYSIEILMFGLRDLATTILGVETPSGEPPCWLTRAKSSLVVVIFLGSLVVAAAAISLLCVSDRIRLLLLYGSAAALWALLRRFGRRLPHEKSTAGHRADI